MCQSVAYCVHCKTLFVHLTKREGVMIADMSFVMDLVYSPCVVECGLSVCFFGMSVMMC